MQSSNPVIIAATTDLFVQSRLNELAGSLGLTVRFASDEQELRSLASSQPRLVILDLSSTEYDPMSIARALKQNKSPPKILGYYPHVRKDLEARARDAGVDFVIPNSSFLKSTRKILETEMDRS